MVDISTTEILANVKKININKFPEKRVVQKTQISREISRSDFPGGNTSPECGRRTTKKVVKGRPLKTLLKDII